MVCRKGGTLQHRQLLVIPDSSSVDTHFCPASISKYFKSSSVCSGVFILTNVVAMPVFPLSSRAPNLMHVILDLLWHREYDNMLDVIKDEALGSDARSNQDVFGAGFEGFNGILSFILG